MKQELTKSDIALCAEWSIQLSPSASTCAKPDCGCRCDRLLQPPSARGLCTTPSQVPQAALKWSERNDRIVAMWVRWGNQPPPAVTVNGVLDSQRLLQPKARTRTLRAVDMDPLECSLRRPYPNMGLWTELRSTGGRRQRWPWNCGGRSEQAGRRSGHARTLPNR